ncbi:TRAP transporter small permease subunit [Rhodobacterales bacterium HKCCE2091]|nr:TRAP transporter small permease subunit [Rhodobacterales bacterium HKCCE2091]
MRRNPLVWVSDVLLTVTAIPVLVMMVHVTLDVTLKYIGFRPIQGTLEITANYYMVAIVVLPMAFIEWSRQSIAVDLFYQMMSYRVQVGVTFLVLMLCALTYGGLACISWPDAVESFERREIAMGSSNIYIWPSRFLLPIALGITTLICLLHAVRLLVNPEARVALTAIHAPDPEAEVS